MGAAFLQGFLVALALILPLGPQNTFVISQGATHTQYRHVLPVVITAALSDSILITGAVMGVSLVLLALPALKTALKLLGVIFLVWMGWQTWRHSEHSAMDHNDLMAYWTIARRIKHTMRASLLNPHAIMDTVVVIGGGAAVYGSASDKIAYALAATMVSWGWFFAISWLGRGLGRLNHRERVLRWLNRLSASLMWTIAGRYLIQLGAFWRAMSF